MFVPRIASAAALLLLVGCAGPKPTPSPYVGRELYTCCNLRFNEANEASDANYAYPEKGTTLPLGTRVRLVEVGDHVVRFQPTGGSTTYALVFRYGDEKITRDEYLRLVFVESSPMAALADVPAADAEAVRAGKLIVGMTKQEAIMARGYPPFHRTPGIGADEWIYYETRGAVDRVRFVDDRIATIERGPAPQ